jgi:hypothetical protein
MRLRPYMSLYDYNASDWNDYIQRLSTLGAFSDPHLSITKYFVG